MPRTDRGLKRFWPREMSDSSSPASRASVPVHLIARRSSSCGTNASTCACCLLPHPHPPRTRSSPGRSVCTRASRGLSGSLAMRVRKLLGKSRSCCLASQQTLPPHSVSLRRNFALPRRSTFSDKLASPSESFWPRFPAGSHFFLSSAWFALLPLVWLDLPDSPARSA